MSDQTRQGITDAIAAHAADELGPDALAGAWVALIQILSDDGLDGYIFEGEGSSFTRTGLATAYIAQCRTEAE